MCSGLRSVARWIISLPRWFRCLSNLEVSKWKPPAQPVWPCRLFMTQGSGHDQTLDIWSVGILLYEMMVVNSESRSTMKSDYKKLSMLRIKPPGNSEVGRPPFQSTNHTMLIDRSMQLLQLRSSNQACSTLSVVSRTLYAPRRILKIAIFFPAFSSVFACMQEMMTNSL